MSISIGANSNVLSVLAQSTVQGLQNQSQIRLGLIQNRLQAQYQKKIDELQNTTVDPTATTLTKTKLGALNQQKTIFGKLQAQIGANLTNLGDLKKQLTALSNAASAGDATAFDQTLAAANTSVRILVVTPPNPALQEDGVAGFTSKGLGIRQSAAYNFTSAHGRTAAANDVAAALATVDTIFQTATINRAVASSEATALGSQANTLTDQLQQAQLDRTSKITLRTAELKQQLNTQIHLLELQFGQSQDTAASILASASTLPSQFDRPAPGTILSIFT